MLKKIALLSIVAVASTAIREPAIAASESYSLELVDKPTRSGKIVEFSVQLVHAADKTPVPDAQIKIRDFNMEPEGMYGSETVYPQPGTEPGVLRLKVQPIMGGRWGLVWEATVPGEAEPVKDTLVISIPE